MTNIDESKDSERYAAIVSALERREQLADALNKAAIVFLSQSDETYENTLTLGIKKIADIIGLDRLSIWRNFTMPDGLHTSQIYRWDRNSGGTTNPTPELEDVAYAQLAPRWEELLAKDEPVNGPAEEMPEAPMLQSFGVVSAFVMPVFFNNAFWGFVLFEDRRNKRYFGEEYVETMRSAAFLCTNAVIRVEMEQKLAEMNEFNRNLLDSAPIGLMIFNDNLAIIDCNEIMPVICGTSKEYFIRHFYDFSPEYQPDDSKSAVKAAELLRQAQAGKKIIFEWMYRTAAGEEIPSEVTLVSVKHKGENMILGYQYDLRNIKKIEDDMAETEELMHAIKEASPIAYILFDENMSPIDCNDVTMRILDCPSKQYLLDHYWEVFLPESQADGIDSFSKALIKRDETFADGHSTFDWMQRSLNGELIPMENTLTEVLYKGKKYIISFKYDLRSTKKMMDNISKQGELLKIRLEQQELISEISKGFISSGDSETYIKEAIAKLGRYHKVSLVFILRIDYEHEKITPSYYWSENDMPVRIADYNMFDFIRANFPERLPDCSTVPVISCPNVAASTVPAYRALLTVDVNAFICAPLYIEGRLWGILSVEQCFNPRQWTENEKGFVAMTASTIAGVIMRDIYTTMLKDALHRATVASKAKGEFLSNMSHEMRTPLNAIIGMTAIGKNAKDMEHKNYALEKIDNASTHLLGVINNVLDISKIEANMLELSPVDFVFEKMLQKVIAVINFRVDEKKQKLKVHIDPAIPRVLFADDQRLAQIITNLIGNAVKFTGTGGAITLDTRFLEEKDGIYTIQISVSDTGIGISPEQQKKLFQSFQQAETSTSRKFGGTGLGLAISKNIVELMGGKIWIDSKQGEGSAFIFTIQVKQGTEKKHSLLPPDVNFSNVRILATDDDPDILAYIKDIIHRLGAHCDTAESGEEALRLIEQNGSYNIYFIDWKMPGMDGIALTAQLKEKISAAGNAVVVMISAAEWNAIEQDAGKAGVDKFLSKPLFPSTITDAIGECLGMHQTQVEEKPHDIDGLFADYCILLAEDVEINREIVLTLLEPTRLKIDCAENGAAAVRMFSQSPDKYDMIFMDVQMPEMDGYEATRRIRELDVRNAKTIPIVAMTANVFREDIEKCLHAGMNSHVGKPLDFEEVLERLHSYLPYRHSNGPVI